MRIRENFRKGLAALMLLGAFSLPAWAKAPWEAGNRYALIVGIDNYDNDSVVDLKCATSDAKLLKDTLVKSGEVAEDNIFLLTSEAAGESSQPSLTNVVFRLEWLREIVGPGDTLVFYFAGHGVSIDGETFLLTEEADQRSKNTLMVSSLPGKVLNELLKSAGAQNTLVLLDACRNDPTAGRGDADNRLSEQMARGLVFKPKVAAAPELTRNTATIFACSEGERSWEWGDKKQGFFTFYLSEALTKGAYDGEGKATLQSLMAYLRDKVNDAAKREANHAQTPMLAYEGPGADNWILARTDAPLGSRQKEAVFDQAAVAAKVEADELEKKRLIAENEALKAKLAQAEAEKNAAVASGANVDKAKGELNVATATATAASERLALTEARKAQAEVKLVTAQTAKKVAFGNATPTETAQLAELEQKLALMEVEKRKLAEQLLWSERRRRELQRNPLDDFRSKSRRTLPSDIWWFEETESQEATEL